MFRWDGGFIMVKSDKFEEGVQWYQEVLGWKCVDQVTSWIGRKAFMKLPRFGMVTLKSFDGDYEHLKSLSKEGNVTLGFTTFDMENTIDYLNSKQVESSNIHTLPNGQKYCDIIAFDHTKLRVIEEGLGADDEKKEYPAAGVHGFGKVNSIIQVNDPVKSASWYEKHLGFETVEVDAVKGYALMRTEDAYDRNALNECFWDHIWLLKTDEKIEAPNDNKARTYYDIRPDVFFEEYNKLIKSGIKPSEIAGDPIKGWGGFHFYDPDNNRINVWSYIMN
ncbi:VOC family protein [Sutcliffiella rhizosphaerae]|uniref:VOC domain-containing protein n=1 Tax=Sutcliffiella rhizosphaerae TaxID=2880967 RepID=A0ABM8YJM4_9BACI|nr:VOC family protein [Sutcliffiella rhizosphaerae]CAG9620129.1 hypothetical protein BACCIP111883_00897 [Sutcliffiella rhizosphaerae]